MEGMCMCTVHYERLNCKMVYITFIKYSVSFIAGGSTPQPISTHIPSCNDQQRQRSSGGREPQCLQDTFTFTKLHFDMSRLAARIREC